jgi:four helix bundle protein
MSFAFEKLNIWKLALSLSNKIDMMAKTFPKIEMYSLSSQVKRAADSVVLNIAEGSTLLSRIEFRRFLVMANRSGLEVVACLYIALSRKYITEPLFHELYNDYLALTKQTQALIKTLSPN